MSAQGTPPHWAEALLRTTVGAREFDNVSGDLLEEYRETVLPERGRAGADLWYARQVLGFVWRNARLWAIVFATAFIGRTALDWLVPTSNFETRSRVTTALAATILVAAAFWAAWRTRSIAAGPLFAISTAAIAAPIDIAGAAALLATRHDAATMAAIDGSGGLAEVFTLPVLVIVPALLLGAAGGLAAAAAQTAFECLVKSAE